MRFELGIDGVDTIIQTIEIGYNETGQYTYRDSRGIDSGGEELYKTHAELTNRLSDFALSTGTNGWFFHCDVSKSASEEMGAHGYSALKQIEYLKNRLTNSEREAERLDKKCEHLEDVLQQ